MHDSPIRSCRRANERHAVGKFSYGHIWLIAWLAIATALLGRTLWPAGADPQRLASASAAIDLAPTEGHGAGRPAVHRSYRSIEELRVGDRVVANNPDTDTPEQTAVDPATWRLVRLYAEETWPDGTLDTIHVETLQPPQWLELFAAQVGARVPPPLDLVEMGLPEDLTTTVVAVEPCPVLQPGAGRLVLTTVNHLNNNVWELSAVDRFGRQESLRPTGLHKFYSETRHDWVSAQEIDGNEVIRGRAGPLTIVDAQPLPGTQRVYNLTVEGEHVYYVSELGLLAHNNQCAEPLPYRTRVQIQRGRDNLSSVAIESASPITAVEVEQALLSAADRLPTGERGLIPRAYGAAAQLSKDIRRVVQGGGTDASRNVLRQFLYTEPRVRFDIENLSGHNLLSNK